MAKDKAQTHLDELVLELVTFIEHLGDSRELSIAKTKAEEAQMWAQKHLEQSE